MILPQSINVCNPTNSRSPMKTLIVKYIPRNEQSTTKKLLDVFKEEIGTSDVEELDLVNDVPDMLLDNNLLAHINRNILGQKLSPDEEKLLSKMDRWLLN